MKICIAASGGGHLIQCLKLLSILKNHDIFIITFRIMHLQKSLKSFKVYYVQNPKRSVKKYIKTLPEFFKILMNKPPEVVITTGAGFALPVCFLAKFLLNSKIIFIESFSRVFSPSLTGKILYPISDLFIVQWKHLLKRYGKNALYGGSLL